PITPSAVELSYTILPAARRGPRRGPRSRQTERSAVGDLDPLRLGRLGLGNLDAEYTVVQRRSDLVRVDVGRQRHPVVELTGAARPVPEHSGTLPLLELTVDAQDVVRQLDDDVILLHAGQV